MSALYAVLIGKLESLLRVRSDKNLDQLEKAIKGVATTDKLTDEEKVSWKLLLEDKLEELKNGTTGQ